MKYSKLKWAIFIGIILLIGHSCSEDTNEISSNDIELRSDNPDSNGEDPRGANGRNGNGGGQGGNGDNSISTADNDLAEDWIGLFLELERYATGMRPNASARALAYINLAAYETVVPGVQALVSNSGKIPQFQLSENINPRDIDFEIALNTCYAKVVDHFIINISDTRRARISAFESTKENLLTNRADRRRVERSKEWGNTVADIIITYSRSDKEGENQILEPQPLSYEPPSGDGYWTYSADEERALFPYWGKVRTFVVATDETTTLDPIAYSEDPASPYYQEMVEVYNENNAAKSGDDEGLWIAEFWSDDVEGITFSPPSRQFAIANQLIDQYELNLVETLHLYVKLGFSLNDAAVSTWKYKYEHMVMRPNVFIHQFMDPSFQTNLFRLVYWPNPSFPGYPSGHSCFASAASGVFIDFFGNTTNFIDRSHEGRTEFQSAPRSFNSFEDLAEENAFSRIPLGVHIRMDCTEGVRLGYEISDGINEYNLRKN